MIPIPPRPPASYWFWGRFNIKIVNGFWTLDGKKWADMNSVQKLIFNHYLINKKNV